VSATAILTAAAFLCAHPVAGEAIASGGVERREVVVSGPSAFGSEDVDSRPTAC
jgi:hypothetical protein